MTEMEVGAQLRAMEIDLDINLRSPASLETSFQSCFL
jgi:hypothetical protein